MDVDVPAPPSEVDVGYARLRRGHLFVLMGGHVRGRAHFIYGGHQSRPRTHTRTHTHVAGMSKPSRMEGNPMARAGGAQKAPEPLAPPPPPPSYPTDAACTSRLQPAQDGQVKL